MIALKLIIWSVLAGVFIVWMVQLIAMPDPNRADGCIYKSPGHNGRRRRWGPRGARMKLPRKNTENTNFKK